MSNKLSDSLRLKRSSLRRKLRCRLSPSAALGPAQWQPTWPHRGPKSTRPPSPMKCTFSLQTLLNNSNSCDTPSESMFTWASTTSPRSTSTPRWAHPFSSYRRSASSQSRTKDILIKSTLKTWRSNRRNYCHTKRTQWASKSPSPARTMWSAQSAGSNLKTITSISSPADTRGESQATNPFSVRSTSLLVKLTNGSARRRWKKLLIHYARLARQSTTPKIPFWCLSPTWTTETAPPNTRPSPKSMMMAVNLKTKTGPLSTSLRPNRIKRTSTSTLTKPSPAQSETGPKPS